MLDSAILFHGGHVATCDAEDRAASWVWVERGAIRALGAGAPPDVDARRVDLAGRTLAPGFCDAHLHLAWIATSVLGPDLSGCRDLDALLAAVRAWEGPGRGPGASWVVGHGFDETTWRDARFPMRRDLDAARRDRPVVVQRACGHVGVLNTAALEGIAAGPHTDLETGRLAEDDLYAINDRLRPAPAEFEAVLPRVQRILLAHGITAVHDVTSPELLAALRAARDADALGVRVSASIPARWLDDAFRVRGSDVDLCARGPLADDAWLRVLGVKIFVDGSLGARTAWLRAPYADAPETRGTSLYGAAELAVLVRRANERGLQCMVHAIGDAALDQALDALEPVASGGNPLRHRIEHAEVTPADLVDRLARSGVWVCAQPNFAARWSQPGGMNAQRLGARLAHCNAYATLAQAGVPLAFGSDTMPLGPAYGLHGAVRHPLAAERLAPRTAHRAYTALAAALVHAQRTHGCIAPGLAADLVVLSADPVAMHDPGDLRVEATWVAGRLAHERGATAAGS